MLDLMKRSHNRKETVAVLNQLRNEIPGAVIRTTLIAGHPGETETDFQELKEFISEFRFDRLGVFAYSHEEDTYAYKEYDDELSDEIKEARVSELMDIQQNISMETGMTEPLVKYSKLLLTEKKVNSLLEGQNLTVWRSTRRY